MGCNFKVSQKRAVLELVDRTENDDRNSGYGIACIEAAEIQRVLELAPIPYVDYLGKDCWLAGGQLLRWICSARTGEYIPEEGDFDFYFSSLEALNSTAGAMLDDGFIFKGYRSFSKTLVEYLKYPAANQVNRDWNGEIRNEDGNLIALTAELCEKLRLVFLEFLSPEGDTVQLVTIFKRDPKELLRSFDFSITQFAFDGKFLFFGPHSWQDLFNNRFRLTAMCWWPDATFYRIFKYKRRGFRPFITTLFKVSASACAWLIVSICRYLFFRLIRKPFTR